MKVTQGDLISLADQGKFDFIAHGCNCMCRMRRGIAKQIAERWPLVPLQDSTTTVGDYRKLGTIDPVQVETAASTELQVYNMYTQFDWQGPKNIEYLAVDHCFQALAEDLQGWSAARIGIPMIGSDLAGGDWQIIRKIIEDNTGHMNITLVEYQPLAPV